MKYYSVFGTSLAIIALAVGSDGSAEEGEALVYGVDVSFPMHYPNVTNNYAWLPHNLDPSLETPDEYKGMPIQPLGDKQKFYDDLIQGCVDHYGNKGSRCIHNEKERIEMSLRQPQSMVNYTKMGYTKIRAPDDVFRLLQNFWEKNKNNAYQEEWPTGNTYVNHWDQPTYMASVENEDMEGGGYTLKQKIWNAARDTISEWTGQQLAECSLYGIRIYKTGAVLAPHVDRLPLVSSAIINVDQDVEEPWPLEVIGHDGIAVNVTMEPGDLVLYESHSVLHGRPFPLKGKYMANVFIHFEPVGAVGEEVIIDKDLPQYVIRGSPDEANWRRRNPRGYQLHSSSEFATGSTSAHSAAIHGDVERLRRLLDKKTELIDSKDKNGWTPLHEAARYGHMDVVTELLERGADVNARSYHGRNPAGGSVLWWASQYHGDDSPVLQMLRDAGALSLAPGQGEL